MTDQVVNHLRLPVIIGSIVIAVATGSPGQDGNSPLDRGLQLEACWPGDGSCQPADSGVALPQTHSIAMAVTTGSLAQSGNGPLDRGLQLGACWPGDGDCQPADSGAALLQTHSIAGKAKALGRSSPPGGLPPATAIAAVSPVVPAEPAAAQGAEEWLWPSDRATLVDTTGGRLAESSSAYPCDNALTMGTSAVVLALMMFVAAWLATRSCRFDTAEMACSVFCIVLFFQNVLYTLVIASSNRLSVLAGHGAAYAGALVSMSMFGMCLGSVLMWWMIQIRPGIWRQSRAVICAGTVLNTLGASFYCTMLLLAAGGRGITDLAGLPLIARVIDGMGFGLICQLGLVSTVNFMPSERRPEWMANYQFACMLGIGLGPMFGSFVGALDVCHLPDGELQAVGATYISLAVAALGIAVGLFPTSLEDMADQRNASLQSPLEREVSSGQMNKRGSFAVTTGGQEQAPNLSPAEPDPEYGRKIILLSSTLAMAAVRGFVISGLESAIALLLETEYGWSISGAGIAVCCCFLFCIPLQLLYNALRSRMTITSWIRVLSIYAIAGSCLLFRDWLQGIPDSILLLAAASVLFPALFLGDALTSGISVMAHNLCALDSMFSPNMLMLYRQITVNGIGRCAGAVVANSTVARAGQSAYATQQLVGATIFWALLETLVIPFNTPRKLDA